MGRPCDLFRTSLARLSRNPVGTMWRAADLLREHRGDSHVISWAVGGADAVEILLLTEQWWELPARSYTPTRGWTEADMDAGFDRLQRRGLMTGDEQLTEAGRAFREEVEVRAPMSSNGPSWKRSATTWTNCWSTSRLVRGNHRRPLLPPTNRRGVQHWRRAAFRLRTNHRHRGRSIREQIMTIRRSELGRSDPGRLANVLVPNAFRYVEVK